MKNGVFKFKIIAAALALCCFWPVASKAQFQVVASCPASRLTPLTVGSQYVPTMDVNGNICVAVTANSTTEATATATLPVGLTPGVNPFYESLGGGTYSQLIFGSASGGGTQVDATHGLPVNIVAGNIPGVTGPVAPGTAAGYSLLTGAVYTSTPPTLATTQQAALQVSARGGLLFGSQYPIGAVPITNSGTGTTGATTATLTGTSTTTVYICGYSIRANATAATTVTDTITGTITGTLSSILWVAPLASGLGVDEMIFNPCIPASGVNQPIAIISGAPGSGGTVSSKGWGYYL